MVWIRILEQKKTAGEPISTLVSFAFVCLFCTTLILAFSSHLFHSLLWIVLMYVCAGCGTNAHNTTPYIYGSQLTDQGLYQLCSPCLSHGVVLNWARFFCQPLEHLKICRKVTTQKFLLFSLAETVQPHSKAVERAHGKRNSYIGFVTLGNQPETAEKSIPYIYSPTGVLLQQDMERRCPMCMKHRHLVVAKCVAPFAAHLRTVTSTQNRLLVKQRPQVCLVLLIVAVDPH